MPLRKLKMPEPFPPSCESSFVNILSGNSPDSCASSRTECQVFETLLDY